MKSESGLDAIISVFIRYSELSAVKYDVKKDIIKIEGALNTCISRQQSEQFTYRWRQSMNMFYHIAKVEPIHINLSFIEKSGLTLIRLYRDSQTLTEEEMELFVRLLRQEFASLLIRDDNELITGIALSGEIKKSLLQKIRESHQPYHNIFAYREEGRVFVFNK